MLEINNLTIVLKESDMKIIENLSMKIESGKINVLIGPNGSGKSTLVNAIIGHPKYEIVSGRILLDGKDITNLSPDKKAKLGMFISFQSPIEIPGVSISEFLRTSLNEINDKKTSFLGFRAMMRTGLKKLDMNEEFLQRSLNEGFSGGEKKKSEILQMLVLNPKIVILDEPDSGLDTDSLKTISGIIKNFATPEKTILIITHHNKVLEHLNPENVFVIKKGKVVLKGGRDIIEKIEKQGYKSI